MTVTPSVLRAVRERGLFEITWSDGQSCELPFRSVRLACPCAVCIDELTGRMLLQPESVPSDVAPVELILSGNYALKIRWSDQHATGLYTWDRLYHLCLQGRQAASA